MLGRLDGNNTYSPHELTTYENSIREPFVDFILGLNSVRLFTEVKTGMLLGIGLGRRGSCDSGQNHIRRRIIVVYDEIMIIGELHEDVGYLA